MTKCILYVLRTHNQHVAVSAVMTQKSTSLYGSVVMACSYINTQMYIRILGDTLFEGVYIRVT